MAVLVEGISVIIKRKRIEEKFPGGLKPVFDHIKSLGMKPGLWISLGQASLHSKVFRDHPEYWTRYPDGRTMFLHNSSDKDNASACFASAFRQSTSSQSAPSSLQGRPTRVDFSCQ